MFCPLITQTLRIISVRWIPLSLRSKTRRRATLLLSTWICSCQSIGTVNFVLPFTTNVTISISTLQSFRAIVTPADRPKSVRNRCVIEVFGGVLCVVTLLFGLFCRCEGFCHRAESDLFLFSYIYTYSRLQCGAL